MPHETALITTVAAGFGMAFVFGFAAVRLGLPALVGYLLAGVAVGPFTPGFVADAQLAPAAGRDRRDPADVRRGHPLLASGDLLAVRAIAMPGAVGADRRRHRARRRAWRSCWGWSVGGGPRVRARALGRQHGRAAARAGGARRCSTRADGRIAVGWLIVEDLAMVLALVLLPALAPVAAAATRAACAGHAAGGSLGHARHHAGQGRASSSR